MAASDQARFERAKRHSWAERLFRASRRVNEYALSTLASEGLDIRVSHTTLFPHIDYEGTRLVELAARVGTSKQAVGQLVDDLERQKVLERIPDPSDGRAKLIRFSRRGGFTLLDGLRRLQAVEAVLEAKLGPRDTAHLSRILDRLIDAVDEVQAERGPTASRPPAGERRSGPSGR
jgi:DNA-binding MarR family transcriptional regulator